jgi:hypothetical protein
MDMKRTSLCATAFAAVVRSGVECPYGGVRDVGAVGLRAAGQFVGKGDQALLYPRISPQNSIKTKF